MGNLLKGSSKQFEQFEPMKQNRFLYVFPEETGIPSNLVRGGSNPSCSVKTDRVIWNDMKITFYDPIVDSVGQLFVDMIRNNTIQNVINFEIHMLDPIGHVVSKWTISGFISSVNFGELSYSSDLVTEVSINLVISDAVLNF